MLNPQQFPMNREERRKHYKENKSNDKAIYCPRCGHKTRHVAIPASKEYAMRAKFLPPDKEQGCHVVCVACGNILRADIKGLVPYTYVEQVPVV